MNQQVGRYQILDELGRGATGVVYKALDPTIGRTIAIKAIPLAGVTDAEEKGLVRERLLREAQSAGSLSHPNIVTIYDILESADLVHILMEYIDGDSLQDLQRIGAPPAQQELWQFLRQIADALDYAHRKGIVHRDIKPANILISKAQPEASRFAKIADFGVASFAARDPVQNGSSAGKGGGAMIGTPNYMSPEQIQGLSVGGAADQFALGAIVYELLAGERPFNAEGLPALFYQICKQNPKPVESLNAALDPRVGEAIKRALAKDPAERFASCSDFVEAVIAGLGESPQRERSAVELGAASAPPAPGTGSGKASVVGLAAAAVANPAAAAGAPVEPKLGSETSVRGTPAPTRPGPQKELSKPGDPAAAAAPRLVAAPPLSGWERRARRDAALEAESTASRGKFWLILALVVAVAGAALFIVRWNSGSVLPVQVLDSKTGPAAPPPADSGKPAASAAQSASDAQAPADLNAPPSAAAPTAPPPATAQPAAVAKPDSQPPSVDRSNTDRAAVDKAKANAVRPAVDGSNSDRPDRSISDVELVTDPPGAKITIDSNPLLTCTAPCSLNVQAGRHTLAAELGGYAVMRKIFNAPAQDNVFVALEKNMGMLFLSSVPAGSPVSVDGEAKGRTPLKLKLSAGPHHLTLFDGAQRRHDETIEIDPQGMLTRSFSW